jgi:hypothetical protein
MRSKLWLGHQYGNFEIRNCGCRPQFKTIWFLSYNLKPWLQTLSSQFFLPPSNSQITTNCLLDTVTVFNYTSRISHVSVSDTRMTRVYQLKQVSQNTFISFLRHTLELFSHNLEMSMIVMDTSSNFS